MHKQRIIKHHKLLITLSLDSWRIEIACLGCVVCLPSGALRASKHSHHTFGTCSGKADGYAESIKILWIIHELLATKLLVQVDRYNPKLQLSNTCQCSVSSVKLLSMVLVRQPDPVSNSGTVSAACFLRHGWPCRFFDYIDHARGC